MGKRHEIYFRGFRRIRVWLSSFIVSVLLCSGLQDSAYARISIRIDVKNPSETKQQVVPVKQYLPDEVRPQNIISTDGMNVRYDSGLSRYFVYADIELEPGQARTLRVEIEDIWVIADKELNYLRLHAQGMFEALKDTQYKDLAADQAQNVNRWLDVIFNKQIETEGDPQERIKTYRQNLELLNSIKADISALEGMMADYIDVSTYKVKEELLEAVTLDKSLFFAREDPGSIRFKIGISNPSAIKIMKWPLKYYLPKEVREEQIISRGGLSLRYDFEKSLPYLYEDVELQPQEEKIFEIEVEDVWSIGSNKLIILKQHTNKLTSMLAATEYYDAAQLMAQNITGGIDKISSSQEDAKNLDERIGVYRMNSKLMEDIRKDISRLEKLVIQSQRAPSFGFKPDTKSGSQPSQQKVGEPGLRIIGESSFKGIAPEKGTTWKIIFFIIGFMGVLSGVFFFYNYSIERRESRDALSGASTRSQFVKEVNKYIWETPANKKHKLYFFLMDIDNFKEINDNYGHDVGDIFIRSIGVVMAQAVKNHLAFGRLGGDEFAVVIEAESQGDANTIASRILSIFREIKTKVGTKNISSTLSIGASDFSVVEDFHSLYKKADNALYRAKDAGRNTFSF